MILNNWKNLAAVINDFLEFAKFSGLNLNWPQTVIVPLWGISVVNFHRHFGDSHAALTKMEISNCAKYLGVWIGPGSDEHFWTAALAFDSSRVKR